MPIPFGIPSGTVRNMRLTLVRHTRTAVPRGVCYGSTEVELAPTFEEEAARIVATLPPADRLVTSPLSRCRRLAERIGAARALVPIVDERLREMDFGGWEGVPWASISRTELDAWADDFLHARPHGGESVHMMRERTGSAIEDFRRSGVSHIVVTHAGIIRAARAAARTPGWLDGHHRVRRLDHADVRVSRGPHPRLPFPIRAVPGRYVLAAGPAGGSRRSSGERGAVRYARSPRAGTGPVETHVPPCRGSRLERRTARSLRRSSGSVADGVSTRTSDLPGTETSSTTTARWETCTTGGSIAVTPHRSPTTAQAPSPSNRSS